MIQDGNGLTTDDLSENDERRKEIIRILLKFDRLKVDQKLSVLRYIERILNEPQN